MSGGSEVFGMREEEGKIVCRAACSAPFCSTSRNLLHVLVADKIT